MSREWRLITYVTVAMCTHDTRIAQWYYDHLSYDEIISYDGDIVVASFGLLLHPVQWPWRFSYSVFVTQL